MEKRTARIWMALLSPAVLVTGCALFVPARATVGLAPAPADPADPGPESVAKSPQAGRDPSGLEGFTLRQRDFIRQQEGYFRPDVDAFTAACGFELDARIDWHSFREQVDMELDGRQRRGFASYCIEPVQQMSHYCQNQPGWREAVSGRIGQYVCQYGGTGRRGMELRGSTLIYAVDWDAPNSFQFIRDYLGRVL